MYKSKQVERSREIVLQTHYLLRMKYIFRYTVFWNPIKTVKEKKPNLNVFLEQNIKVKNYNIKLKCI